VNDAGAISWASLKKLTPAIKIGRKKPEKTLVRNAVLIHRFALGGERETMN
jgi:hypothetical protein